MRKSNSGRSGSGYPGKRTGGDKGKPGRGQREDRGGQRERPAKAGSFKRSGSDRGERPARQSRTDDSRGERPFKPRERSDASEFRRSRNDREERPARQSRTDDTRGERPFKPRERSDSSDFKRPRNDREERPARQGRTEDDRRERPSRPGTGSKDGSRGQGKPRREGRTGDGPKGRPLKAGERAPFEKFRKKEFQRERDAAAPRGRGLKERPVDNEHKARKEDASPDTRRVKYDELEDGRAFSMRAGKKSEGKGGKPAKRQGPAVKTNSEGLIRLNKYLSNAGVASRRDADTLIQSGAVKVNGVVVSQLGHKIHPDDKVTYGDTAVRGERKVYLLLNKPKDYITTVDDPQERKTVMQLIAKACKERVYPVGRLDRNTTGLLLFTNDGELTTKLTHPKYGIKKVYHVSLNKGLKPDDFKAIVEGLELEDGLIKADDLAFVGEGKKEIGIEIHSGRNRIVRRIFEHLGYDVLKLDRVVFAGLTKKDLPRGKYRFLTAREIGFLQMIG